MVNRTKIINHIADKYGLKNYLEIGVRDVNDNFKHIKCKNKDGVDPDTTASIEYNITSDSFFENYVGDKMYDIIFVDGLHTSEQSYKDVKNAIKCLNDGGFILMHDCNPPTEYHARSYTEYLKSRGEWNGDVFKAFIKLKKELTDWGCFVVDEDFGCGVITKNKVKCDLNTLNINVDEIGWDYFDVNRNYLLNLMSFETFKKII